MAIAKSAVYRIDGSEATASLDDEYLTVTVRVPAKVVRATSSKVLVDAMRLMIWHALYRTGVRDVEQGEQS